MREPIECDASLLRSIADIGPLDCGDPDCLVCEANRRNALGAIAAYREEIEAPLRAEIERLREALDAMLALHAFEHSDDDAVSNQARAALAPSAPEEPKL